MPKRSELVMQGLVDRIIDMFHAQHMTQIDIAEKLNQEGYHASKSAVGRVLKKHSEYLKEIETARKEAEAIIQATRATTGTDIADATLQITITKLLGELKDLEDLGELSGQEIINAIPKIARAQGYLAKVKLDFEEGFKKGLFASARKVDELARQAGVGKEAAAVIKSGILGLNDGPKHG